MITQRELNELKLKFPQGIPQWMIERGFDVKQIELAMVLRREVKPEEKKS